MTEAHERRKRPEVVRPALLDAAARLTAERGLAGWTLRDVALGAGVTKGGLFHHFDSKAGLIEAMARAEIERFDAEVEARLEPGSARGRFSRAYVAAIFASVAATRAAGPIFGALMSDPGLGALWTGWLAGRLDRHRATDAEGDVVPLEIARLAADGIWLADLWGIERDAGGAALRARLMALTRGD